MSTTDSILPTIEPYSTELLWLVVIGFVVAFVLAFGIGANDVANSFGTSVGAKVVTITQACCLATVFELAGAVLIGYKVSDTMRKGILDVSVYEGGGERALAAGCVSALAASGIWLIAATALKLPVSGTHSIVGATVGFSLAARGVAGLRWGTLGTIVLSWFISPVLSGLVSVAVYSLIKKWIIMSDQPIKSALRSLPIFYGVTIFINVMSVMHDGPKLLHMDNIPFWAALVGSSLTGAFVAAVVQLVVVPRWRKKLLGSTDGATHVNFTFGDSSDTTPANTPTHLLSQTFDAKPKRPLSLISTDAKHPLDSIMETTENLQMNNFDKPLSPRGKLKPNKKTAVLATMDDCSLLSRSFSPPKAMMIRRDVLDSNINCLNNVDLTITSLNFIDETLSNSKSIDSSQTCGMANSYDSGNSYLKYSIDSVHCTPRNINQVYQNATDMLNSRSDGDHKLPSVLKNNPSDVNINPALTPNSSAVPLILAADKMASRSDDSCKDDKDGAQSEGVMRLFSFLQILTAMFGSFAHGGNDVSNAIGPLVALWLLYTGGNVQSKAETPLLVLVYGGAGITLGLWLWGRRVIATVGEDLTTITPDTGFTIEIGAALTVLFASKAGLPISTTHCKVGSVVFVGAYSSGGRSASSGAKKAVDWKLFSHIIYAWIVTVPVAAALSAGCMLFLENVIL